MNYSFFYRTAIIFTTLCALILLFGCSDQQEAQPFGDYLKLRVSSSASESKLTPSMLEKATKIKIDGTINAKDFEVLRAHDELEYLNLANVNIVGPIVVGYVFNDTINKYEALKVEQGNAIPFGAFGKHDVYELNTVVPGSNIDTLFYNDFTGRGKSIRPSEDRIGSGVEIIEAHKRIKSVVFPKNITHIGRNAFAWCETLTEPVKFPSSLRNIMDFAFDGCHNLTGELSFPQELNVIGNSSFMQCHSLTGKVVIPKNINTIFVRAFLSCRNITEVELHDQLELIGSSSLAGISKMLQIRLPESLWGIDFSAFSSCSGLKGDLTLPEGFEVIMDRVFYGCDNLDGTLTLNAGLERVENYAFHGANFKTIIAKWNGTDAPIPGGWRPATGFWFPPNFETSAGKPEYVIYIPQGELEYYTANFPASEGSGAYYNFKEGSPQ